MIEITNLSKKYGDFKALKSISFKINKGEIVGFLGANGAGKSTTLKIITGYLSPTSGKVSINNYNVSTHPLEIQSMIGYLPEQNPLYEEMKVYDYLHFIANTRGIKGHEFEAAIKKVISECGLHGVIHKNVSECSKGFKQRIGLAAAMIHDPEILILDEPVTGLDPNQIVEIRQLIKGLAKKKLVLMSSHILQEIQATVDRIIIINEGEIIADGTSNELISQGSNNNQLKLEIKNASKTSIDNIRKKLSDVEINDINGDKNLYNLILEYPSNKDYREDIFNYANTSGWTILEMSSINKPNLENIFRNLTKSVKSKS